MSKIKSDNSDITIDASGSGRNIKFQANGVEKASISSAGAFTSTTIDATKLTGDLPAISGANLTGVGVSGITSSADATAITIDSSENVGIGTTTPVSTLEVAKSDQTNGAILSITNRASTSGWDTDDTIGTINFRTDDASTSQPIRGQITSKVTETLSGGTFPSPSGMVFSVANGNTLSETLRLSSDGRGLSNYTAKAWCRFDGGGTPSFSDSFNCSSLGDWATGNYGIYMTSGVGNGNYAVLCLVNDAKYGSLDTSNTAPQGGRFDIEVRTVDSNFSAEDVGYVSCLVFGD